MPLPDPRLRRDDERVIDHRLPFALDRLAMQELVRSRLPGPELRDLPRDALFTPLLEGDKAVPFAHLVVVFLVDVPVQLVLNRRRAVGLRRRAENSRLVPVEGRATVEPELVAEDASAEISVDHVPLEEIPAGRDALRLERVVDVAALKLLAVLLPPTRPVKFVSARLDEHVEQQPFRR